MPPKYRQMADFHEYYSGARTASCLTIFIGGNHEASNHLFELYYGGWVAPNIYYLGAANVLNFGPLRIAGLSGIWKGYDYRKPHFERLPYNQEEMTSIFHVRELDVRKLLALRSQVDIGLSHDWPQGVEFHGDYNWLFGRKPDFGADAYAGKLGSVAARQCLDRLRPPYWFSAHLHTKFAAVFPHNEYKAPAESTSRSRSAGGQRGESRKKENINFPPTADVGKTSQDLPHVSAWQQFHAAAQQEDVAERDRILKDGEDRRLEEEKTGIRSGPGYTLDETFNKVGQEECLGRTIVSTTQSRIDDFEEPEPIPQVDGCSYSRPAKRPRLEDHQNPIHAQNGNGVPSSISRDQTDGATASLVVAPHSALANPDAIDIDMSSDDDTTAIASEVTPRATPISVVDTSSRVGQVNGDKKTDISKSLSEDSEDGGVKLNPNASAFAPMPSISSLRQEANGLSPVSLKSSFESILKSSAPAFQPQGSVSAEAVESEAKPAVKPTDPAHIADNGNDVSDDMRAQLAALSTKFTPKEHVETSPALPFPDEIANKTTEFLALGKCDYGQEFLQLLDIGSLTSPDETIQRPLSLSYDPEWLAVQRVFASELQLGGVSTDKVSHHRGDTYYQEQIEKEKEWISEHVVKPNKLRVPENFTVTASIYDPNLQVESGAMPREVTNPQTSAYCELVGIENKFDIGEEERDFRDQQGPRPESESYREYQSRPRQQGRGGGRRGGHRGGGDRGRGGGRGRGRRGGR